MLVVIANQLHFFFIKTEQIRHRDVKAIVVRSTLAEDVDESARPIGCVLTFGATDVIVIFDIHP
jgi:hypothetical protein